MTTTPRTITRAQYLQLVGLHALAAHHIKAMDDLTMAALAITQERDGDGELDQRGHTNDLIWHSRTLDEGLKIMGITVEEGTQ